MQERALSIRFHHLDLWGDFISSFIERFGNRRPWEMTESEFEKVGNFVKEYLKREIDTEVTVRNYSEKIYVEDPKMGRDFNYLHDMVGESEESHKNVLAGRIAYYTKIIDMAFFDNEFRIKLSRSPDDYRRSCAIGKHCKKTFFQKFRLDRDMIYKKVLEENHITTGQLFDPEFYKALQEEAKTRYPSWFRD